MYKPILVAFICFLMFSVATFSQTVDESVWDWEAHAFGASAEHAQSVSQLANYLAQGSSSDYGKARIAFAWIAKNIAYDAATYNKGSINNRDVIAENVLKRKRAVCTGFSNLYKKLCTEMGIECIVITGYAKGYGHTLRQNFDGTNHAWNAIKIADTWHLVDVTWGEGYVKGNKDRSISAFKKYKPYWFDVNPYEMVFSHFPQYGSQQFLPKAISQKQAEMLDSVDPDIFQMGADGKQLFEYALRQPNHQFPDAWSPDFPISIYPTHPPEKTATGTNLYLYHREPGKVGSGSDQWPEMDSLPTAPATE